MKLEFHQLDRRYEHLRTPNREQQGHLLASIAGAGQQTPIIVVAVANPASRYAVIDGYKRIAALQQLGRDTVEAVVWDMSEAEALVLDWSMRFSHQETALEQGWLLAELEERFGYSLHDLARRLDRSVSWVSRRLALVEQIPETVQQQVRAGEISAHVAMKYLVPLARANERDCQRMAEVLAKHRFSSRQAGEIYAAWRDASPSIRQRILDSPEMYLKAQEQVQLPAATSAEELLKDLTMMVAIASRASRRFTRAAPLLGANELESALGKIRSAVRDLTGLSERVEKEKEHVEPKSTQRDSGTARQGSVQTRDCASPEIVASERPQSLALEVVGCAGSDASRES